ncbi:MAG: SMC-Scp complex subunit ScpB [bacterium]|nr:SMC-Scp complex subunit ScpB [bacterium]
MTEGVIQINEEGTDINLENSLKSSAESISESPAESQQDAMNSDQPVPRPEIDSDDLPKLFEALLFVAGSPLSLEKLCNIAKVDLEVAKQAITVLKTSLEGRASPVELIEVNGGFQFRTKEFFAPFIQELKRTRPRKLSPAALETLAVIAYRQPVVKSDMEAIRGVDVTPTLKTLLDRKMIRIVGYQATVGQPALYGTTDLFLEIFGLRALTDLPALKDLKEINEDPGEGGFDIDSDETDSEGNAESSNASEEIQHELNEPIAANE